MNMIIKTRRSGKDIRKVVGPLAKLRKGQEMAILGKAIQIKLKKAKETAGV